MGKKIIRFDKERTVKALQEKCACYVLITCSPPSSDGRMEVEMNFEGDEALAALLIEEAAQAFNARSLQRESQ